MREGRIEEVGRGRAARRPRAAARGRTRSSRTTRPAAPPSRRGRGRGRARSACRWSSMSRVRPVARRSQRHCAGRSREYQTSRVEGVQSLWYKRTASPCHGEARPRSQPSRASATCCPRRAAAGRRSRTRPAAMFRALRLRRDPRCPIVERTELFARSLGETTDIVEKEMYTFDDRDETSLTLRPEATAGVVRAYRRERAARSATRRRSSSTWARCSAASGRRRGATASSTRSAPR